MNNDLKATYNAILHYYKQHNKFPLYPYLISTLRIDKDQLRSRLNQLYSLKLLDKNHRKYVVNEDRIPQDNPDNIRKVKEFVFKMQVTPYKIFITAWILIGILTSILSIYFTYLWFKNSFNWFISLIFSSSITGFSILSFEAGILYLRQKKKSLRIIAWVTFVICILVLIFSMNSTVGGLYRKMQITELSIVNEDYEQEMNEDRLSDLNLLLDLEKDSIKTYSDLQKIYKDNQDKSEDFDITLNNLTLRREHAKNQTKEAIKEVLDEKQKIRETGKVRIKKRVNYYTWLSEVFGGKISVVLIQFISKLFPAICLDIMAQLAFAFAMFTRKEYFDKKDGKK